MKSRKIFSKAHIQQEREYFGKFNRLRQFPIPTLVLTFFILFSGLGFVTLSAKNSEKIFLKAGVFEVKPTPISDDQPIHSQNNLPSPTSSAYGALPVISDLDFDSYRYHSWDIPDEIAGNSDFWMEIDLTNQMLYAYRDNQLISGFKVSTGTSSYKTVTGTFKIFSKYPTIAMSGPGYDLPDVPYTMFFYKGYAIHGTYWHHNFGVPMSHGCVNMNTDDAAWIYKNAPVGTYVMVHY
jgi:hypothetical protein